MEGYRSKPRVFLGFRAYWSKLAGRTPFWAAGASILLGLLSFAGWVYSYFHINNNVGKLHPKIEAYYAGNLDFFVYSAIAYLVFGFLMIKERINLIKTVKEIK